MLGTRLAHRISALVFQPVGWDVSDLTRLQGGFTGEISGNNYLAFAEHVLCACQMWLTPVILSGQMEKFEFEVS